MLTVDLHSHILPDMDDGASDVGMSMSLLREEFKQGIEQIVFTPHYYLHHESVDEFLSRRDYAWNILKEELSGSELNNKFDFHFGAEIRYSTSLPNQAELDSLCISGTKVLLLEFSPDHFPENAEEVIYRLQLHGFVILLAHVERFPWLRHDPDFLYRLVISGVYAQFNADSVIRDSGKNSFIHNMLKCGLVHGIGSDTHNPESRPPHIKDADTYLAKKESPEIMDYLNHFGKDLLSGRRPETISPTKPKKNFWHFFRK